MAKKEKVERVAVVLSDGTKHDVDEIKALLDVMDEQHGNESASSRIKGSKP